MMQSISPLTGKKYPIPKALDHKEEIDDFLFKNKGKKVIVVQGLGFVGAVMSLVCANSAEQEYAVIGIDLPDEKNFWKICSLNEGIFPLTAEDPKMNTRPRQTQRPRTVSLPRSVSSSSRPLY